MKMCSRSSARWYSIGVGESISSRLLIVSIPTLVSVAYWFILAWWDRYLSFNFCSLHSVHNSLYIIVVVQTPSNAWDTLAAKRLDALRSATIGYDWAKAVHPRCAILRASHQAFQLLWGFLFHSSISLNFSHIFKIKLRVLSWSGPAFATGELGNRVGRHEEGTEVPKCVH